MLRFKRRPKAALLAVAMCSVAALAARALPLGYAVSFLDGIWRGEGWSAHLGEVAALTLFFLVFTAISSRVFRWE